MTEYDIGFLGGGQLARMSIQAAQRMGFRCLSLENAEKTPASQVADNLIGKIDQAEDIARLLSLCERVTLENEFIPPDALAAALKLSGRSERSLLPSIRTLGLVNDKLRQRATYERHGVPSPLARAIDEHFDPEEIGFPMVIKARFGGYDGKGTRTIKSPEDLESYREFWALGGWHAEQFVPFRRELAVMVFRSATSTGCFPTMESIQTNHVCDLVYPAGVDASLIAIQAVEAVEGFGLFGVELFETEDGSFQVNEIAPRPHNSGHYTLDWGGISQFEQHVRLIMGLTCQEPTGQPTCMANLLGQESAIDLFNATREALATVPDAHVHWYGKSESRSGRKMGHINVVGPDCVEKAELARSAFYRAWAG